MPGKRAGGDTPNAVYGPGVAVDFASLTTFQCDAAMQRLERRINLYKVRENHVRVLSDHG